MIYIRIIIGNNLVSIFRRILFSASILSSALIAATNGGGTSLRCPSTTPFPASRVVGAILSSEICSIEGFWSSAIVVRVERTMRLSIRRRQCDGVKLKCDQCEGAATRDDKQHCGAPSFHLYEACSYSQASTGVARAMYIIQRPSCEEDIHQRTPIRYSRGRLPTTVQECRPAGKISISRRRRFARDSSIGMAVSRSNMLMQRCACDTG